MDYANPFKLNMKFYDVFKTLGHKVLKVNITLLSNFEIKRYLISLEEKLNFTTSVCDYFLVVNDIL